MNRRYIPAAIASFGAAVVLMFRGEFSLACIWLAIACLWLGKTDANH